MAADEKWYFTKEQLTNTPSRKCGIDADKELSYRQQAANFIQDMGQKLHVTQLCINTAIVYMHRFYVFHSLSQFHRNSIASAALFLAAKVEEQPRKLESVIKISHLCLHREATSVDIKSEQYLDQAQDLVFNENVLLQTLGFDVAIDHPHTHVVRCCQLVKASKDLAQTSYFMASNSLHLTTMCLQYKPTVVACFCIHLACKWSNWEIPQSNEGKYWFWYVDRTVTAELLQQLTAEFLHIFDKCPSRLKKKIMSISENQSPSMNHQGLSNSLFDAEPRRINSPANDGGPAFQSLRPFPTEEDRRKQSSSSSSAQSRPPADYREHREKKERERLERERITGAASGPITAPTSSSSSSSSVQLALAQAPSQDLKPHSHHHKPSSTSTSSTTATVASSGALITVPTSKHPPIPNQKTNPHHNHHHHRPDVKFPQPSQRHSSSSQSRDMSRQRIPRDYSTTQQAPLAVPPYPHGHQINSSINDGASTSDMTAPNDSLQIHQNPVDKLANNNNHNAHRPIQHDKRAYDPRHKLMEHRKEDQKNYPTKYIANDQARVDRQRKPDSLEQRSEEVRKLIEKPLPLPKPRAEVQKEEYIASMLKQSHHPKYGQDKIPMAHNSTRNLMPHDFSKASTSKSLIGNQHSHGVTPIMKDIKNGNSNATTQHLTNCNNVDDPKAEKRPRSDEQISFGKHKSLFSPEKVPINREQHSQRLSKSSRQKTPPVSVKSIKQERIQETTSQSLQGPNLLSSFPSSYLSQQQQQQQQQPNVMANYSTTSHKRNKPTNIGDIEQPMKIKIEDQSGFEAMKMLGRIPELIQPIRDTPGSTNGRTNSVANDLKPPELIKPFEPEVDTRHAFTNGLDVINIKNEPRDLIQRKDENNMNIIDRLENPLQIKNEYLSPLKSAQSISALLQEPLAPMPSLLQPMISESSQNPSSFDSGIFSSSQTQSQDLMSQSQTSMNMSQELAPINDEQFSLSTVDISALSTPVQIVPEVPIVTVTNNPLIEVRKTEHHKSEKKKKKEKHKHKDKDKSKEKHKHKHKDKDKEKHRDKDREKDKDKERNKDKDKDRDNKNEENSAAPIKITIPKDKLNLTLDSNIIHDKTSPQGTKLKIKIPKERLKGADSSIVPPILRDIQAPLKIKIRTSGAITDYPESRKREREFSDNVAPPSKKSQNTTGGVNQLFIGQQSQQPTAAPMHQQRSGERQNGRHYSSGSNNKEKHSREHKSSSKLSQSQQFHAT
ncbi:hypothetical protein PV327_008961 [Microctonus hyperodae]|uniref:Cyclin-like domain-containing protein n=1 Tax=Microctonus hyperodae TaxID=165561 RepID=A0AA39FT91_MICHY|nr:hypothetical protein PV327_008961 [Microctonus hyperodae]